MSYAISKYFWFKPFNLPTSNEAADNYYFPEVEWLPNVYLHNHLYRQIFAIQPLFISDSILLYKSESLHSHLDLSSQVPH